MLIWAPSDCVIVITLKRVVFVSMGCSVWASLWPELHLTQTRLQEGYWWHFPWAFKLPGHLQSRWELNHRPRTQLLWKMAFQPLNHHLKFCFSKDTYSVILCFLAAKVPRLKFLFLCNTAPALPCSSGTIKPACAAGAPLGQPWNGCLSIMLVGNQIVSGFLSSAFFFICSKMPSWLPLKLKVDKSAQTSGFLQLSKYWFTSGFCKKWHEILLISKVICGLVTCES